MSELDQEFEEFATFHVKAQDGRDVEMAVVDEFDFENVHYIVGAVIEGDVINDEGGYIYKYVESPDTEEGFIAEKIRKQFDYNRIAKAYMEMA